MSLDPLPYTGYTNSRRKGELSYVSRCVLLSKGYQIVLLKSGRHKQNRETYRSGQ